MAFEFAALGQQGGQEGYNRALQTFKKASKIAIAKQRRGSLGKKQSKIAGSNRRGKTPVNKKKLSAARRQLGKEGRCKFSGNGSSQKLVKAKVRKMLRYFNMYSTWHAHATPKPRPATPKPHPSHAHATPKPRPSHAQLSRRAQACAHLFFFLRVNPTVNCLGN